MLSHDNQSPMIQLDTGHFLEKRMSSRMCWVKVHHRSIDKHLLGSPSKGHENPTRLHPKWLDPETKKYATRSSVKGNEKKRKNVHTRSIHVWCIFTYIWLIFMINVGKYLKKKHGFYRTRFLFWDLLIRCTRKECLGAGKSCVVSPYFLVFWM